MNYIIRTTEHKGIVKGYIDRLPDRALGYKILIEPIRQTRSMNQNNYYWGVIIKILGEELGYRDEEMHDALRMKFLQEHGKIETIKSTTGLNTKEFEEYLAKIREWASEELSIFLPLPNEVIDNV